MTNLSETMCTSGQLVCKSQQLKGTPIYFNSPRSEICKTSSSGLAVQEECNSGCRSRQKTAKNQIMSAIICLIVGNFLQMFRHLIFMNAFRMNQYATRPATRAQARKNYNYSTLFSAPEDNDIQQQKSTTKDPFEATGQDDLFKTLAGGPALIFEMARKSMLFANKETDPKQSTNTTAVPPMATTPVSPFEPASSTPAQGRWYPHSGIADVNDNFRTQSPIMNNKGFEKIIWKNARKKNKPSQWKYALRTYDRMALLEGDPNFGQIKRLNIHHEGAMQACAKLGLWQRALEIYHYVYQQEMGEEIQRAGKDEKSTSVYVTDDMVLSLVRSTVRASRLRSRQKRKSHDPPLSPEQEEQEAALRRIPLDTALEILSSLPEKHNIPLVAYYLNPLAAAYQSLGYTAVSKKILETFLTNRTAGEDDILNVHDLCAKDKGSYSLLVQASVVTGDWGAAVDSLSEMTNAGIYPNSRHCNVWSEISERQTRPRAVGSWKKKRDDYWTDSVR